MRDAWCVTCDVRRENDEKRSGCWGRGRGWEYLAEARLYKTKTQSKHRKDNECNVEDELRVQLADALEVVVLVAIDGEHGGVARVSAGGVEEGGVNTGNRWCC
jgi:hypothetical protein